MNFTRDDIRRQFSSREIEAGDAYRKQGRVLAYHSSNGEIHTRVRGGDQNPYKQTITIGLDRGKIRIAGQCTCPVGYNCKHVAAALLYGLELPASVRLRGGTANPALPVPVAPPVLPDYAKRARQLVGIPVKAGPVAQGLPPELASWLAGLELARVTAGEDYPPEIPYRIVYTLCPVHTGNGIPRLAVQPLSTRLLKDGTLSASTHAFRAEQAFQNSPAKHLRPADFKICRILRSLPSSWNDNVHMLVSDEGTAVLALILATGRALWVNIRGEVMTAGPAMPGQIVWEAHGEEAMRPVLQAPDGLIGLNGMPPVYVDAAGGLIGELDTGLPPKLAFAMLEAPPVALEHLDGLGQAFGERLPGLPQVRPPRQQPPVSIEGPPQPVLRLMAAELPVETKGPGGYNYYGYVTPTEKVGIARLLFRYGPCDLRFGETRAMVARTLKGQVFELHRDTKFEQQSVATLLKLDFVPAKEARSNTPANWQRDFLPLDGEMEWFDILYRDVPLLRAAGFAVEIDPDFPLQLLNGDGEVAADIGEGSGIDWLELGVGIMVDGQRIDLIGPIVAMIAKGDFDPASLSGDEETDEPIYLPLGEGRFIALPPARFAPILQAIYALASGGASARDGKLRLARADAAGIGEFEAATLGAGLIWRGGERIRDMGRKLANAGGIPPVQLPATFAANLRPYQAQGVAWLAFLCDVGLGGILADDMGLGKTVQALALLAIEKAAGRLDRPALVVAPTSLMANWRREAEKFAPDLKVLTLQGNDRKEKFGEIASHDLVLSTYPLIARDHEVLKAQNWHLLFLDEAQTIKNPEATTSQLIRKLDARHRFCLTGTPLENHLGELWSLFTFASPGFLGDKNSFAKIWRTPIEKLGSVERGKLLAKRVRPFMLRRTKAEVASDLPPKTEIVERIDMGSAQSDIYESIRLSMHEKVRAAIAEKGFARSAIIILDALLKLRQTCCDPRLLKLPGKASARAGSAKLERLMEILEELVSERRKIIVFSQFTSMLDLIRPALDAAKMPYCLLTGQTTHREKEIRRFQDSDVPIFLISLKAGGTGLNLTQADTVILYDPWWNPAVEEQAIDRAHRIGQDKPVFVHKLVMNGTIEEKMEMLKEKKRALAQSIFDADGAPTLAMTENDLDMLFAAG